MAQVLIARPSYLGKVQQCRQHTTRKLHWVWGSPPGLARPCCAARHSPESAGQGPNSSIDEQQQTTGERWLFFASGNAISLSSRRRQLETWPELEYSAQEALETQLKAIQANNTPYADHGVEVLYRFAAFDPFNPRTKYFGKSFDLGQFERFRRIMHTTPYATLLGHQSATISSSLQVSDHVWVARIAVVGAAHGEVPGEVASYEVTMVQRVGGVHDGYWFTQSLVADGNDWQFMRGSNNTPWRAI